jgi:mycothiol synthase
VPTAHSLSEADSPDWRPIDPADLPALARLELAADVADGERFPTTLDDLTSMLLMPGQDLGQMSVAIQAPTGELIGWCWLEPRIGGAMWNRIHVHGGVEPGSRGNGHGRALLHWAEGRARDFLVAADGARRDLADVVTVHAAASADSRARLHAHCGYAVERWYSDMFRSLKVPVEPHQLPAGYRFIAWTRERDAEFHAADVDAFRDHWGSAPWTADGWRHEYADDAGFRPDLTVGVEHAGQVVGYVMMAAYEGIMDDEGQLVAWLARLGVRRDDRGRGVGGAAITRALDLARTAGFATAGLDVDTESLTGALRLYERLGFYPVKRLAIRVKTLRAAGAPVRPGSAS